MGLNRCPECANYVSTSADKCPHCGYRTALPKDNTTAGCLGLVLGPVGLWYKGQWAAGFAWLAMTILLGVATGGLAAPFCWIGMAIHAAMADTK